MSCARIADHANDVPVAQIHRQRIADSNMHMGVVEISAQLHSTACTLRRVTVLR